MAEEVYRSTCCGAEVRADGTPDFLGSNEVCTIHHVCLKCNNACGIIEAPQITNKRDASILDWTEKNRPDLIECVRLTYEWKFEHFAIFNPLGTLYLMLAIGFEAGRQFQKDNPELDINNPGAYSDMDAYW